MKHLPSGGLEASGRPALTAQPGLPLALHPTLGPQSLLEGFSQHLIQFLHIGDKATGTRDRQGGPTGHSKGSQSPGPPVGRTEPLPRAPGGGKPPKARAAGAAPASPVGTLNSSSCPGPRMGERLTGHTRARPSADSDQLSVQWGQQ